LNFLSDAGIELGSTGGNSSKASIELDLIKGPPLNSSIELAPYVYFLPCFNSVKVRHVWIGAWWPAESFSLGVRFELLLKF
jgi:hypothetical protein